MPASHERNFPLPLPSSKEGYHPGIPKPSFEGAKQARHYLAEVQSERGRNSLRYYMKYAFRQVEPNTTFMPNWHIDVMAEYLQAVTEGHIQNLVINLPPRHQKSLSVSVFWPTWGWIHQPGMRYLFSSYSSGNAIRDTIYSRRLILSTWYQERWGWAYRISRDVNRNTRVETTAGGFRVVHGVGGGITGEGGQTIVVDDPHELDDDMSPSRLRAVADWWDEVMASRVNNPATAARVIVQQRIHDKDLSGHVDEKMKEEGGRHYEKLILPAEYEPKFHHHFSVRSRKTHNLWHPKVDVTHLPNKMRDELGMTMASEGEHVVEIKGDPRTEQNELLWHEKMPRVELEALKVDLGRKASGQLQQRPVPSEGDLFKERFFRYWRFADKDQRFVILHMADEDLVVPFEGIAFLTCDLATSLAQSADETVISTWMWLNAKRLIWLGCEHGRMEGPDIVPAIQKNMSRADAQFAGIEKSGFQLSIVQQARRTGMPVLALLPDSDKRNRAIPAAVMMDGEQIFLPRGVPPYGAEFTVATEAQLLKFTGSPNDDDDIVDTLSYAVWVVLNKLNRPTRKRRHRSWGKDSGE